MTDKRIGLIFGGGGEVGIAWEIGVVAALQRLTSLRAGQVTVVAGTSAGAVVGAHAALGHDFTELAAADAAGRGARTPTPYDPDAPAVTSSADAGDSAGTAVVPHDLLALLMSTEGSTTERAAAIGQLALTKPTAIDQAQFVTAVAEMLGANEWPTVPFRPTAVDASTGQTHLWSATDGADLATAVASSCAVPGFFPLVTADGRTYFDGPRTPLSAGLVQEYALDAVLFIGLDLPILSNNDEATALRQLQADGVQVATITGGPGVADVAAELMDPGARPRAVQIGQDDGAAAADLVTALLDG